MARLFRVSELPTSRGLEPETFEAAETYRFGIRPDETLNRRLRPRLLDVHRDELLRFQLQLRGEEPEPDGQERFYVDGG